MLEARVEFGLPWRIGRRGFQAHLRAQRRRHPRRTDDGCQQPLLLSGAERLVDHPLDDPLGESRVPGLGACLHQRGRDPHEIGRDLGTGRFPGLVELCGRLLNPAGDRVGDRRMAERQRVVGKGREKCLARHSRFGEFTGRELQLHLRGHEACPARGLGGQPLHLFESRRNLITFDEPVDLFEVAGEIVTAKLDLLAGAAGARCVGIDGHGWRAPVPSGEKRNSCGSAECTSAG